MEIELVRVSLSVHFLHDILVVVIAQSSTQLVIIHIGFALALAPLPGHLIRVEQLELAIPTVPRDAARVRLIREQLEQELP